MQVQQLLNPDSKSKYNYQKLIAEIRLYCTRYINPNANHSITPKNLNLLVNILTWALKVKCIVARWLYTLQIVQIIKKKEGMSDTLMHYIILYIQLGKLYTIHLNISIEKINIDYIGSVFQFSNDYKKNDMSVRTILF